MKILNRFDGKLIREVDGDSLSSADLSSANLSSASLSSADLRSANLSNAKLPHFAVCPEEGAFIGWKKLGSGIVAKLGISSKAKRTSSLVGRKCRAEFAKVLWLSNDATVAYSTHDPTFKYELGKIVHPAAYNDDIRVECAGGIHFFITRLEAEEYV